VFARQLGSPRNLSNYRCNAGRTPKLPVVPFVYCVYMHSVIRRFITHITDFLSRAIMYVYWAILSMQLKTDKYLSNLHRHSVCYSAKHLLRVSAMQWVFDVLCCASYRTSSALLSSIYFSMLLCCATDICCLINIYVSAYHYYCPPAPLIRWSSLTHWRCINELIIIFMPSGVQVPGAKSKYWKQILEWLEVHNEWFVN